MNKIKPNRPMETTCCLYGKIQLQRVCLFVWFHRLAFTKEGLNALKTFRHRKMDLSILTASTLISIANPCMGITCIRKYVRKTVIFGLAVFWEWQPCHSSAEG